MSTTLSTQQMVARLQRKVPIGLSSNDCMDFLNEGFRKINQMSKGGFIWQLKSDLLVLPPGGQVVNPLPADFDPGKKAIISGSATYSPTRTEIPYKPWADAVNEQHFPAQQAGAFSCWTFTPNFTLSAPTSYGWTAVFFPNDAFPILGIMRMPIFYHAVNFQPFTVGATTYFPTPDQFDSFIVDLAEAEYRRIYRLAGWEQLAASTTATLQEMVSDYRTDRLDLAGLADQALTAQEKQVERAR